MSFDPSPRNQPPAVQAPDRKPDGAAGGWLAAVIRRWKRRRMAAALEAMDDRLLRDMGIFRGDITHRVAGFSDRELGMVPLAAPGKRDNADAGPGRQVA